MRTQVKDSQLHKAIASMAQFLESFTSKQDYGFLDGGETLEINSALLDQCRESDQWLVLEQAYQQVNGNIYCPDGDLDLDDPDFTIIPGDDPEVYLDVC